MRRLRKYVLAFATTLNAHAADPLLLAPPSPDRPWPIPDTPTDVERIDPHRAETAATAASPARPAAAGEDADGEHRRYDLAALIDLAQRTNPDTRASWEQARQAALAVGLVESTYLPQLSADVIAGYQRTPLPIPATLIPKGNFVSDTREAIPSLVVKWLLFDFGRRDAAEQEARSNSFVANVAFSGAHQKLIFEVSRNFYALGAARGRLRAAGNALGTAQSDHDAVLARRTHGLATSVDVAKAERQVAQARFTVARTTGAESVAYASLIESLGVAPTARIDIDDGSEQPLPALSPDTVDRRIDEALSKRPDVIAAVGKIRGAQAALNEKQAQHRPTVALLAQAFRNVGALRSDGGPYSSVNKNGGALLLQFSWPIYDGGLRDAQVSIAQSQVEAARDHLEQARSAAAREVVQAYAGLTSALAEHDAALVLTSAARTAHAGALESYRHGVGTYTSLIDDENALTQAETELEDSRASVFTAAAALAFATGSINAGNERSPVTAKDLAPAQQ
ncbi:MAG TPA: TolC family protein [Dokdonella sp.]